MLCQCLLIAELMLHALLMGLLLGGLLITLLMVVATCVLLLPLSERFVPFVLGGPA